MRNRPQSTPLPERYQKNSASTETNTENSVMSDDSPVPLYKLVVGFLKKLNIFIQHQQLYS